MIDLFGLSIPTWVFVLVIAVVVIAAVGIPMYKGYKKEMEKPAKKGSGSKKSGSSKK